MQHRKIIAGKLLGGVTLEKEGGRFDLLSVYVPANRTVKHAFLKNMTVVVTST